jgi:hypothetical protein
VSHSGTVRCRASSQGHERAGALEGLSGQQPVAVSLDGCTSGPRTALPAGLQGSDVGSELQLEGPLRSVDFLAEVAWLVA